MKISQHSFNVFELFFNLNAFFETFICLLYFSKYLIQTLSFAFNKLLIAF